VDRAKPAPDAFVGTGGIELELQDRLCDADSGLRDGTDDRRCGRSSEVVGSVHGSDWWSEGRVVAKSAATHSNLATLSCSNNVQSANGGIRQMNFGRCPTSRAADTRRGSSA
jgi:hypothetical protein